MGLIAELNEKKKKGTSDKKKRTGGLMAEVNEMNRLKSFDTTGVNDSYISSFVDDANSFLTSAENEYDGLGWGSASSFYDTRYKSWQDLDTRRDTIKAWLYKNRKNIGDDAFNSLYNSLDDIGSNGSSVLKAFEDAKDYYSQWDTEEAYNEWKKADDANKAITSAEDFEANKGYKSTASDNWWDKLTANYGLAYDDLTYEYINNQNGLRDEIKSKHSIYSMDNMHAEGESDYEQKGYDFLTDDEIGIYNYYYNTQGKEKAQEYLDHLQTTLVQRKAGKEFEALKGNALAEIFYGVVAGADQFRQGVENLGGMITGDKGFSPSSQYVSGMVREDLADDGFKVLGSSLGQIGYDLVNTTTNMLPSILVGSVTGGLGGALTLGASATGNAYAEMRHLGYDRWQSTGYAALVGASETALQYALGGISKLGGKVTGNAIGKLVSKFDNAIARTAIQLGGNMASEGLEEAIQTVLEPVFKALVTGEDFEAPEWEDVLYSALLGALSAGVMEGAPTIARTIGSNIDAKKMYGNNIEDLLVESAETGADPSIVDGLIDKYGKKGTLSGYDINRLVEANESALVSQDKGKIKDSVKAKLEQYGETGNIDPIADVITKIRAGENITKAERDILVNSKYGRRVSTELNPDIIRDGTHNTAWVEEIGTERIGADVYNRSENQPTPQPTQRANVNVTPPDDDEKSNANKTEISAEDVKTTITKDGQEVDVKVDKIESIEGDEISLKLDNGEVVNASDVDFGGQIGLVYQAAKDMTSRVGGFNIDTANVFVKGYTTDTKLTAAEYVHGFSDAYRFGKMGYPASELERGVYTSKLSKEQRETAYNFGKAFGNEEIAKKSEKIVSTVTINAENIANNASEKKKGRVHFDGSVAGKTLTERQKASLKGLGVVAEAMGIDIHVFESNLVNGKRVGENGSYDPDTKKIRIDLHAGVKGDALMLFTASHELTHHIREVAPGKFKIFADALLEEYTKNGVSVEKLIEQKKQFLDEKGRLEGKTEEEAYDLSYEEVVADSAEAMLVDSNAIEALSRKIHEKDKGLWNTIKSFIAKLVARIKAAYKGLNPDSAEANYVRDMVDSVERLQKLWVDALLEASDVTTEKYLGESGVIVNSKTDSASLMSVRDLLTDADRKKVSKALAERFGVTQNEAMDWLKAETSLASLILNPKYSQYLDYTADSNEEAIKSNSDYPQGTVDFSNICKKRRDFTEVMNRVLRNFPNHVFAATDLAKIRTVMEEEGMEVACAICYVEDRRQLDSVVAQDFIDSLAIYREGGKIRPDGKPFNANQIKAFKLIEGDTYTPSIYELISLEGRNSLKAKNPAMEEAWVKFNNARGMQSVRLLLNDAEYKRQILKYTPAVVKRKNDLGGLRIYSFSDAEMFHLIDIIQVITDSATVGLSLQGYTKVNEYARAVKDTGEKLNRSLIPKGDLGYHMEGGRVVLDFDTVEGIDINHPDFFDNIDNPNIGNIVIGINATQIKAAMTSKFIDQIIPFHTGQSNEVLGEKGIAAWDNYKDFQSERDAKTKKKSAHQINIYTEVINAAEAEGHPITNKVEFVNKFLEVCKENDLIPRFSDFLNVDENGNYVYTEGYHKFLVDFKTFDQNTGEYLPQMPVKPIFDNEYLTGLLRDYVKTQEDKDAKLAKSMPKVLDRITNEIVNSNGVKFSDRNSLDNSWEKRYNLYTATGDFLREVAYNDRHAFARSLAYKTSGMADGEIRNIIIYSTAKVYVFRADGYMHGEMITSFSANNKQMLEDIANEYDKIDQSSENASLWAETFQSDEGGRGGNSGIYGRGRSDSFDTLYEDASGSHTSGDPERERPALRTKEEIDEIIKKLRDMYGFDAKNSDIRYSDRSSDEDISKLLDNLLLDLGWGDLTEFGVDSDVSIDDISEELNVEPERVEILIRRKGLGDSHVGVGHIAVMKQERIDEAIEDSGATRPDYARKYITRISPKDFIDLTVSQDHIDRGEFDSKVIGDHGSKMGEYDYAKALRDSRSPYLNVDTSTGKVIGHNGRHRMRALEIAGVESVEIEVQFFDEDGYLIKYNAETIQDIAISSQFDTAIETHLANVIPLNEAHRAEIEGVYGEKAHPDAGVKYQDRESYAPTFYSHMGKVIDDIKLEKMGTSSILNHLKNRGVKDDEIKWSGIEAFLEGKKSVTKAELQEFVASSQLRIEEEMSGAEAFDIIQDGEDYIVKDKNGKILETWEPTQDPEDPDLVGWMSFGGGDIASTIEEIREYTSDWYGDGGSRWSQYRLDGGENYRELVFKMPGSEYTNDAMRAHWGQDAEGVLAHARIQDLNVNGKKMLFIEEIQSDWHNEGHQRGYLDESKLVSIENTEVRQNKETTFYELYNEDGELLTDISSGQLRQRFPGGISKRDIHHGLVERYNSNQSKNENGKPLVPDAPFKNNYHEYVLKRLLRMAVEEGYDSIGWTPSQIQSERWSSDFAEGYRIEYDQDIPKFLRKYGKKWGATVGKASIDGDTEVWSMDVTESMKDSVLHEGQVLYSDRNTASFKGKAFWSGSVSLLDGVIEEVHTMEEAEAVDFHHSMYFSPAQVEKMENGENAFFWVDDGKVQGDWRESVPKTIIKRIEEQIKVKYQDRNPDSFSNRSLLANALETAAQNDIERNKLKQYKQKIDLINAEEQKLHDLREQIKELSFKKGARDTEAIKSLQFEANQAANRINTYDRQLLNLESTKALKGVLEREKAQARKRAEKQGKEALERYREKAAKTQRELMDRYQESRKRGVESRNKTAMRHKIKDVVNELNNYLLKGTKEKHIPIELQKVVAEALDAVNMDTVGANERIAKLKAEMLRAKTPEAMQEIAKKIDHIEEMGGNMEAKISRLKTAYDGIINSEDPLVANSHDEVISNTIGRVMEVVGNTPLRDMSLYQLEAVYDMYRMVLHSIRTANKAFKAKKSEEISVIANRVLEEIDKLKKKNPLRTKVGDAASNFDWNNLKPVYAFERIGSESFTEVFNNVRAGEDTWAVDMTEAQAFLEAQKKDHGYNSWDFKKRYEFTSSTGKKFELSLEQIMSLYAYAKRGDQAKDHLKNGGFVFDGLTEVKVKNKLGVTKTYQLKDATSYNISDEILAEITSKLSPEQMAFADAMQDYLSTTMGEKGNEVSLELYGVKLFKEKNYFPLKSAPQYLERAREQAQGDVKIKNKGFTKETAPKAKNPIVLTSFMDVWAGHVNEMSMYHAFTLALEDFYRVFNYKTPASETMDSEGVIPFIENAHGGAAVSYIDQLLKDLNGGARSDPRETVAKALMSRFKKTAVMGSLSVVVQQPTAIVRAMALVDAKYFGIAPITRGVVRSFNRKKHKALWEEVKKYAPVAIIKEMGYFDTGMGKSSEEWLKGEKTFMDKVDDVLAKAPAIADELAWISIWNAVKRETASKNPTLQTSSEEFLKLAGERFTEVITKTQVYDSTLSKSSNMRSKSAFMNMWTSFMAEPTTTINMVMDAFRKGNKKYVARVLGATVGSIALNAALVSLVYAMRDDDEDETMTEKYLSRFTTELVDGINPVTYLPFFKDVWSLMQGFDIERADMSLINDLIGTAQTAFKTLTKDISDMSEDELSEHQKSVAEALWGIVDSITSLAGIPEKNIRRDINGIINLFKTLGRDMDTTYGSLMDNIGEDLKDSIPVWGWLPDNSKGDKLYDAIMSGDTAYVDRLKSAYKTDKAYESAVRSALRENDSRIHEAAQARYDGDLSEYTRIAKEIIAEGNFKQDDVVAAINSEISAIKKGETTEGETEEEKDEATSIYSASDINAAFDNGDNATALEIINDLVKTKVANGKTEKEAKSSIRSSMTSYWKPLYKKAYESGNASEMARIRKILYASGLYGSANEVVKDVAAWLKD